MIEKCLDYDREVSRLRSRSVSTTIEKCLDYDREVSRLRSRSVSTTIEKFFSTTIEKVLDHDREDSRKSHPLVLNYCYREASRMRRLIDIFLYELTCCSYYMPLSFTSFRKWQGRSLQTGLRQGLNSRLLAGLRPLVLLQVLPPNPWIPRDRLAGTKPRSPAAPAPTKSQWPTLILHA